MYNLWKLSYFFSNMQYFGEFSFQVLFVLAIERALKLYFLYKIVLFLHNAIFIYCVNFGIVIKLQIYNIPYFKIKNSHRYTKKTNTINPQSIKNNNTILKNKYKIKPKQIYPSRLMLKQSSNKIHIHNSKQFQLKYAQ